MDAHICMCLLVLSAVQSHLRRYQASQDLYFPKMRRCRFFHDIAFRNHSRKKWQMVLSQWLPLISIGWDFSLLRRRHVISKWDLFLATLLRYTTSNCVESTFLIANHFRKSVFQIVHKNHIIKFYSTALFSEDKNDQSSLLLFSYWFIFFA